MSLVLHEGLHISSSLIIGLIAGVITKQWTLGLMASLIAGVFIDLDHFFDYWRAFGTGFNLKYFLKGYQFLKSDRIYIPLHGFEYSILLFLAGFMIKNDNLSYLFIIASISLLVHLLIDTATNEVRLSGYFVLYRLTKGFVLKNIVTVDHYQKHQLLKKKISLN